MRRKESAKDIIVAWDTVEHVENKSDDNPTVSPQKITNVQHNGYHNMGTLVCSWRRVRVKIINNEVAAQAPGIKLSFSSASWCAEFSFERIVCTIVMSRSTCKGMVAIARTLQVGEQQDRSLSRRWIPTVLCIERLLLSSALP
jgi:hypothetical protein